MTYCVPSCAAPHTNGQSGDLCYKDGCQTHLVLDRCRQVLHLPLALLKEVQHNHNLGVALLFALILERVAIHDHVNIRTH